MNIVHSDMNRSHKGFKSAGVAPGREKRVKAAWGLGTWRMAVLPYGTSNTPPCEMAMRVGDARVGIITRALSGSRSNAQGRARTRSGRRARRLVTGTGRRPPRHRSAAHVRSPEWPPDSF